MDKKKVLKDVGHEEIEDARPKVQYEIKTRIRREKWRPKEVFE